MTYPKPASCADCTLINQPGPVWGVGDPAPAKLGYVAQNPGKDEVAVRPMQPLVGPSGNVFNYQLFQAGIRRDQIYITNQVKCLTPNNREPTPLEVRCCKPLIDMELARLKADTVVLAGALSFRANIGSRSSLSPQYIPRTKKGQPVSLFERMGCVEQFGGKKWIGTIHPAFVMRMPEWKETATDHLKKAMLVSGLNVPMPKINEHPTDHEILQMVDYICLQSREFADDVETVGMEDVDEDDYCGADFLLTMCGISSKPHEALVLDPRQMSLLEPIFRDVGIWRYEHNGPYDNYHIAKQIGEHNLRARCFDTMLATHYLRSYAPKKLKPYVVSQYTTLPYWNRDLGKLNMRLYNGMDCVGTFQAAKRQRRELEKWQLEEIFFEFGMPLLPILEEMRVKGVNVDLRKALLFKRVTQAKINKAETLISKVAGPMYNPYSPQQTKELLYDRLQLPVQYLEAGNSSREATKKPTTNFEARKRLRWWIAANPERQEKYKAAGILLGLLDFISGEKKKLEYIDRISGDGRLHGQYKAHGASSFRLSSSPNLQNFPVYDISAWGGARRDDNATAENPIDTREEKAEAAAPSDVRQLGSLRSIVIPDDSDDLILTCDMEQLQLWIIAAQWNVKWLLEVFHSRSYIYGEVFEKLYKEPFFQPGKPRTKKYKLPVSEQRMRRAKAVPLGFLFGRSAEAVAKEYGWELKEAQALRKWWFDLNPELLQNYARIKYTLEQKGWIRHCWGQVIHYPTRKLTEAINSHAQSPEAFFMSGSMIQIDRELKRRKYKNTRLILQVHDSLSLNVGGARSNPDHLVEVAEEVVFPVLGRVNPQLNGFQFRYSAEVSELWDWETVAYSEDWRERFC